MLRLLLTAALLLAVHPVARAQECPAALGVLPSLGAESDTARLQFLKAHLSHETQKAQRWTLGWTVGFSALAVGQLALIPVARNSQAEAFNRDSTPDLVIGAAASTVGLATLLASRLSILRDGPAFAQLDAPNADPCQLRALGEAALRRSAETERPGTGPLMHAANAGFNVAVGLVLGIVFKRWRTALINTLVGTAIGELKILTQPTGSIDAWRRYREGDLPREPTVTFELLPVPNGLTLAGTF